MSRQNASARLTGGTPDLRQRPLASASTSTSASFFSPARSRLHPPHPRDGDDDPKGKGKGKGKGKAKAKWEVGTKGWVKEGFRRFGEHCARNQIRTLLIDCLVMTNLFYPSLVVWYQKRASHDIAQAHAGPSRLGHLHGHEDPLSVLSTPLLESFFPEPPRLLPPLRDGGGWWHSRDGWNATSVSRSTVYPGPVEEEEIRVIRIGWTEVDTILARRSEIDLDDTFRQAEFRQWLERDHALLSLVRDTAERWEGDYPGSRERCVRELAVDSTTASPSGSCIVHRSDSNDGVTRSDGLYHCISVLMRVPRASAARFEARWTAAMRRIAEQEDAALHMESGHRKQSGLGEWRVTLDIAGAAAIKDTASATPPAKQENRYAKYFILLYLAMFIILVSQVNFATRVHSKFGLAITGIVQLCCSAIMSLSVLALIGWNGWGWSSLPSSVPVWVLPMVIVIVGVENMSTLTKAVFSVPFHYSVPERIGLGLSRSGTKILLTSLTNILALAIIWYLVDVVPVREFCLFAITVNITDWFMLHTFYLTVISIDAQRLELADVLATSGNQDPATQTVSTEEPDDATHILSWRGLVRGKMFNSGTLVLTLVCIGVIYLLTGRGASSLSNPSFRAVGSHLDAHALLHAKPFITKASNLQTLSDAERLWRAINPHGWPFVRVSIPAASILILPTPGHPTTPRQILDLAAKAPRARLPRLKPLFYLFKVVILPQALTAGSLGALLMYLLKDAELLDAQRDRLGRGEEIPLDHLAGGSLAEHTAVHMLPCGHASDIDQVAVSHSGKCVVSVGLDNTIALWRFGDQPGTGTREQLKSSIANDASIVAVAISLDGTQVAAAFTDGQLQVWQTGPDESSRPLYTATWSSNKSLARIQFHQQQLLADDPFRLPAPANARDHTAPSARVVLAYTDGSIDSIDQSSASVLRRATPQAKILPVRSYSSKESVSIECRSEGEYLVGATSEWTPVRLESHAAPGDRPKAVSPIRSVSPRLEAIAIGRQSGIVEVFDAHSGDLVVSVGQNQYLGGISKVDIAAARDSLCTGCGTASSDGLLVISSAGEDVYVDRVIPPGTIVCRCAAPRRSLEDARSSFNASDNVAAQSTDSLVVPPCSARAKLSPTSSPRRSPSLLPPTSNGEFPLSSHGMRKLSAYQTHEQAATPASASAAVSAGSAGVTHGDSVEWSDMEVVPLGAVHAPSGKWLLLDNVIVGLRRSSPGIGHDQWQLWTVDLASPYNGSTLNVGVCSLAAAEEATREAMPLAEEATAAAERAERLHSISGRACFPPVRGSFSVPTYPQLAYIDVGTMLPKGNDSMVVAFGNQLGVITLPDRPTPSQAKTSPTRVEARIPRSRLGSTSGIEKRPVMPSALGLTPPPPRRVSEDRKAV